MQKEIRKGKQNSIRFPHLTIFTLPVNLFYTSKKTTTPHPRTLTSLAADGFDPSTSGL